MKKRPIKTREKTRRDMARIRRSNAEVLKEKGFPEKAKQETKKARSNTAEANRLRRKRRGKTAPRMGRNK